MKAHQRLIRERLAANPDVTLFGVEGANVNTDLTKSDVREIDDTAAASIILKYEWLGTMPRFVHRCFGLFHDGMLSGAVVFAEKPGANLPSNAASVIPSDALYLARGACAYWAHPHAASWLIARACRQQAPCTVLAYADPEAGEVGTIYQALGWWYLGASSGGPHGFVVDGVRVAARSINRRPAGADDVAPLFQDTSDAHLFTVPRVGQTSETLRALRPDAGDVVPIKRKGRYVGAYGDKRFRRAMTRRLAPVSLPYPKRG